MISTVRLSKFSLFALLLTYSVNGSAQEIDERISEQIEQANKMITENRQDWFDNLRDNIITTAPEAGSKIAEWDRVVSNEMQKTTGARLDLANADKSQDSSYLYNSFMEAILGKEVASSINIRKDAYFKSLESTYKLATYAWDDQKNRNRSIDFILKDRFLRGRPYQVLDANGDYKADYSAITGSSYPSGHTWNGFRQAATLAMVFPEIGGEIFSRAIEYGESRVIVGAHFATDTIASRVGNYHAMAQMLADDNIADTVVALGRETRGAVADACHMDVRSCIAQNSTALTLENNHETGYYGKKDPETAPLITPDEIPDLAAYLLRLRFPYLEESQWKSILAGTAYPSNSLAGWNIEEGDPNTYWGLINLPDAYNGPSYFYDDFIVNQDGTKHRYDLAGFSTWDTWKNDISGSGRLIKEGDGTLHLAGNDSFAGLEVNHGNLIVSGESRYTQKSTINQGGTLLLSGTIGSDIAVNGGMLDLIDGTASETVSVENQGEVIGEGVIGSLIVNQGGILAPGHSIGTLKINNQLTFEKGSQYLVEINPDKGRSDQIINRGDTQINGGIVAVSLEDQENLLTKEDVHSLLGSSFNILQTEGDLKGEFEAVMPNYLFVGATVDYDPKNVTLKIDRNKRDFASVANTFNQREIANAIDRLPNGHSVYESFLKMNHADQAITALDALSGQVHANMMSAQIDGSRAIRTVINSRLSSIDSGIDLGIEKGTNSWVNLIGHWNHVSSDDNAFKYSAKNYGVLFGADAFIGDAEWKIGIAGGYTHTSLSSHNADGNSDNFHLALYGGKSVQNLNLRGGIAHTWHRIETSRNVGYGNQFDTNSAKYNASTSQLFLEGGYRIALNNWYLEPFANLAYIHYKNDRFSEDGGSAALTGKKQSLSTTLSTLGLRTTTELDLGNQNHAIFSTELGWQHQLNGVDRAMNLAFRGQASEFGVRSVSASKESFLLKLNLDLIPNKNSVISIGYNGMFSKRHRDNSVNANFTYHF
ncbi:autotransporter domain-containing protein [Ignatzschineria cameli]|uniref:autotransporter domain-containing protein n=1 Tax=Ignatzschineria cameli TaxID=2182793 RepID=UPI000D621A0A|nr:autotransporter domain-containing protein [Ignatzschineria cameli]PWD85349.1 autotransporter outer membrane beta-barrel domain-containing protein [Ignatzschineria cameli]